MKYKDRSILFASDLVPLIKKGIKTLTYRIGDKYEYLEKGDSVLVQEAGKDVRGVFAEVEITDKYHTTFGELSHIAEGHEKYSSKQEMRDTFKKHYQIEVKDDQDILVLGFRVNRLL